MIQILEGTRQHVLSTKAIGTISSEDYSMLIPCLEEKLSSNENLRWYSEMEKFVGWESEIEPRQLLQDIPHTENLKKVAVVGGLNFRPSIKDSLAPFSDAEIKFFEAYQKQEAIAWAAK